jgi:acyl dehydratase
MSSPVVVPRVADLAQFIDADLGPSEWIAITQERIDAFASATDDDQWIHVDVDRASRESKWGGTIAHGYLTLALAPKLLGQILEITDNVTAINSGLEKMRLSTPVLAGERVRMSGRITGTRELPGGGMRTVIRLVFEVEGSRKPACTVSVVYVYYA